MAVELVRMTTPDGVRLDGAWQRSVSPAPRPTVAIGLHGVGGNFYSSNVLEMIATPLLACGIDMVRVNTRGHDSIAAVSTTHGRRWQGAAFEVVDECRFDIQGWIAWAREQGYERIVLAGHSLGGLKALYAAAHEELEGVVGIAAISPPRLSYSAFRRGFGNDKFFEAMAAAERLVHERHPDALFQARFPFPIFLTASGYIDKYGPRERYNLLRFLDRIRLPVLITYGTIEMDEGAAFHGVPDEIAALPRIGPVRVVTIPAADHLYSGQQAPLQRALTEWLASLEGAT